MARSRANKKKKTTSARNKPKAVRSKGRPLAKAKTDRVAKLLPSGTKSITSPLEKCLIDYVKAQANPFTAQPACVPHTPLRLSSKEKYIAKGTFTCGTNGFGYIVANTQLANNNVGGLAAGQYRGWYASEAGYTPTSITNIDTQLDGVGQTSGNYNSPYLYSQLVSNQFEARVVALGVRARYMGTEQGRNGRLVCFETPSHDDLSGASISGALSFKGTESVPVTKKWTAAVWHPMDDDDLSYKSLHYERPELAIMVDGVAGDKYEFEIAFLVEAVAGLSPKANETPTFGDDGTFAAIQSLLMQTSTTVQDTLCQLTLGEVTVYSYQLLKLAYEATKLYL